MNEETSERQTREEAILLAAGGNAIMQAEPIHVFALAKLAMERECEREEVKQNA